MLETIYLFILLLQVALVALLWFFIWKCAVYAISGSFEVPFVPTPASHYAKIREALEIGPGDVVYDLGCGTGRLLMYCAKNHPEARFVGIERNSLLWMQAKARGKLSGNLPNIEFKRDNFYTADFSDATRIYAYLLPSVMNGLFSDSAHSKARLVSRAFKVSSRTPLQTIEMSKEPGWHGEHLIHIYQL